MGIELILSLIGGLVATIGAIISARTTIIKAISKKKLRDALDSVIIERKRTEDLLRIRNLIVNDKEISVGDILQLDSFIEDAVRKLQDNEANNVNKSLNQNSNSGKIRYIESLIMNSDLLSTQAKKNSI